MADGREGFLGRWVRRKSDQAQGRPLAEPAGPQTPAPPAPPSDTIKNVANNAVPAGAKAPDLPEKTLSLDDVGLLTGDSDFKPFMAGNVGQEVRNAAMKKLFTDPRYNVMDGLDIYIDDYSKADPIPQAMLRQMVGAKLLKIFDDEEEKENKPASGDASIPLSDDALPGVNDNSPPAQAVAQCGDAPNTLIPIPLEHSGPYPPFDGSGACQNDDHAHTHLRLQPDHASPAPDAGRGAA